MRKLGRKIKAFVFRHFDALFAFFLMVALGHFATMQLTMDVFDRKIQPLERFQEDRGRKIMEEVEKVEAQVVALNADEQLFIRGQRADGSEIEPPYKPFTIRVKGFKGQPTDRVTLRDTGDFHDSFRLEFEADQFTIVAGDIKSVSLERKYGEAIMGLTQENIDRVADIIREPLLETLKRELG